jgi:hypothetical protein
LHLDGTLTGIVTAQTRHRGAMGAEAETSGNSVGGPWLDCPWCGGAVPLAHLVPSDEEPGARVAVCDGCGRRVAFTPPDEPGPGSVGPPAAR